ncbi:ester cyclase [Salininema proteolyticum]|uniref:Ester cyclase n=1 Tax=Salininema proteolyticum TaxID=1607685 RepID=A0ABV8U3I6_9ACTN
MVEDHRLAARRALEELYERGDLKRVDDLVHPDFYDDEPGHPDLPRGPEAVRRVVESLHRSFGDLRFAVEDEIAEGAKVVQRVTMSGRQSGPMLGHEPTGAGFSVRHIYIWEFADDGRILRHWGARDDMRLLEQTGLRGEDGGGAG